MPPLLVMTINAIHPKYVFGSEHNPDTDVGNIDHRITFKYDVLGNRIELDDDADGDGSGTAVVTKFAYDLNGNAWADLNGSGSLTTRRLYLDAVDALFAEVVTKERDACNPLIH
jgi:hypothetical protein